MVELCASKAIARPQEQVNSRRLRCDKCSTSLLIRGHTRARSIQSTGWKAAPAGQLIAETNRGAFDQLQMNAGPSGFGHAPVSKGLVLASIGSTVIQSAARSSHRRLPPPLVTGSKALAFKSGGELLFGCLLMYYFRVLERQTGSTKFGSYAAVVTGMSYTLQFVLGRLFHVKSPWAPGPLPLVFASFIPFMLDIPASNDFTVLGYKMTDKVFVYLAGLQLLLTSGRKSVLVMVASTLASVLYRLNFCGVRRLRIPGPVVSAASKLLGPLLCDQQSTSIVMASSNAAQGGPAAAGGLYAPAAGIRQPPSRAAAAVEPSPSHINTLVAMGFSRDQAMQALQQTGNDVQTAIALLVGGH